MKRQSTIQRKQQTPTTDDNNPPHDNPMYHHHKCTTSTSYAVGGSSRWDSDAADDTPAPSQGPQKTNPNNVHFPGRKRRAIGSTDDAGQRQSIFGPWIQHRDKRFTFPHRSEAPMRPYAACSNLPAWLTIPSTHTSNQARK